MPQRLRAGGGSRETDRHPELVSLDDLHVLNLRPPLAGYVRGLNRPQQAGAPYLGNLWRRAGRGGDLDAARAGATGIRVGRRGRAEPLDGARPVPGGCGTGAAPRPARLIRVVHAESRSSTTSTSPSGLPTRPGWRSRTLGSAGARRCSCGGSPTCAAAGSAEPWSCREACPLVRGCGEHRRGPAPGVAWSDGRRRDAGLAYPVAGGVHGLHARRTTRRHRRRLARAALSPPAGQTGRLR